MHFGPNLTRRDAWTRVSHYVGLWLIFWLVLGLAGRAGIGDSQPELVERPDQASDFVQPKPPVLQDFALRGRIERPRPEPAKPATPHRAARTAQANGDAPVAVASRQVVDAPFGDLIASAPPGFADLMGVQNTQADVYFYGQLLVSTFIEFDLEHVWFMSPEEIVEAIPTLKNPQQVLVALSGKLDSNTQLLCNRRVRENCGELEPDIAGVIFDESKFRIDLFVNADELEVQMVVGERYLPAPSADWATLHDVSVSASGQFGLSRYNLAAESFLSKGGGRVRLRYGLTNNGASLQEASWQWDKRDREYEIGTFRSARGNSLFINDKRLLGLRGGSSTKTRTDLDNALATPIFIFLEQRTRVDVLRDGQILDSRFYPAGNHQLDTTRLPDGAYDIAVRSVDIAGAERVENHFFVRSSLLPPLGENQYYYEAGAFTDDFDASLPKVTGGGWVRGGISHRLNQGFALESELLFSGDVNLLQSGAYFLGRGWQMHAGLMASDRGDLGYSFRGQYQRKQVSLSVNVQHLDSSSTDTGLSRLDPLLASNVDLEFSSRASLEALESERLGIELVDATGVVGGSYTQASASLSFPLTVPLWNGKRSKGRAHLRARYNKRDNGFSESAIGVNYNAPIFRRNNSSADLNLEGLYASDRSLVRIGVDFRWSHGNQRSQVRPQWVAGDSRNAFTGEREDFDGGPVLGVDWNRGRRSEWLGDISEGAYLTHDDSRSIVGGRFSSQSNYGYADFEVNYTDGERNGLGYIANSRFNLVSKDGRAAVGGGSSQLAALVVEIDGDLPDSEFEVIVDNRVAGYASSGKRGLVSLRPYDSYEVRIRPTGDDILGYDEATYAVTLYPGNVHQLVFAAKELHVLIAQALLPDGSPVVYGRFDNVEGFGATDSDGWFQVEVSHDEDLRLRLASGEYCTMTQPPLNPDDEGLAVVDALVCRPIQAPRSE